MTTQRTDVKQTITYRARVQVRFCSHFSFFRSPCSLTAPPFPVLVTSVCHLHKQLHQGKTLHCCFIRDTALDDTSYSCEKIEENPRNGGNGNFDSDFAAITLVIEELFSIQSC